jgi:hypothetical protein
LRDLEKVLRHNHPYDPVDSFVAHSVEAWQGPSKDIFDNFWATTNGATPPAPATWPQLSEVMRGAFSQGQTPLDHTWNELSLPKNKMFDPKTDNISAFVSRLDTLFTEANMTDGTKCQQIKERISGTLRAYSSKPPVPTTWAEWKTRVVIEVNSALELECAKRLEDALVLNKQTHSSSDSDDASDSDSSSDEDHKKGKRSSSSRLRKLAKKSRTESSSIRSLVINAQQQFANTTQQLQQQMQQLMSMQTTAATTPPVQQMRAQMTEGHEGRPQFSISAPFDNSLRGGRAGGRFAGRGFRGRGGFTGGRYTNPNRGPCWWCSEPGHVKTECKAYFSHLEQQKQLVQQEKLAAQQQQLPQEKIPAEGTTAATATVPSKNA